jgi:hypothetical protein
MIKNITDIYNISQNQVILIVIIALIMLIIYNIAFRPKCKNNSVNENMINVSQSFMPSWSRNKCDYLMNETLSDVLSNNSISYSDDNWTMQFPCGYDEVSKEIDQFQIKEDGKYFLIDNIDIITAKEFLWSNMLNHHGMTKTLTMMPVSYILYNNDDITRFTNDYDPKKIYIMKKNIQRQEGLLITNDKNTILNGAKNSFVLAQELLQDPYTIGGRKINMRFYVLVVCKKGDVDVYTFNDGFMYYTKDLFKKGSLQEGPNITTGYIDRWVYKVNPLTHNNFREYLDKPRDLTTVERLIREQGLKLSQIVFNRIYKLLADVFIAYVGKIGTMEKMYNSVKFQIFGVDIAINDQLYPMVMEINKGPDMGAKDERDSELKHNVVTDMMRIVGEISDNVIENKPNGFIKILDIENNNVNMSY